MDYQSMPMCCRECVYSEDVNEDPLNSAKYICKIGYKMRNEICKRQRRPTRRAVDKGDSAPLQAESTPEHLPIEEADTTPALRN